MKRSDSDRTGFRSGNETGGKFLPHWLSAVDRLTPPRAVPVEFLNPAFPRLCNDSDKGLLCFVVSYLEITLINKKMRMKSKIFTSFLLAAVLLSGCKNDPAPDKATLSVSPQTAIAFTAAATETFTVKVVTNQPAWKAESSQKLVQRSLRGGSVHGFRRSQYVGNSSTPAVITVTAGSEKATIDVTQAAAGKEQYPDTEAKLKQAIAKVWTFAESSNYVSLEFTTDDLYTFLSKNALYPGCGE